MQAPIDFAANLRAARARAGMNQGHLAKAIQITQTNLSKWERGLSTPNVDKLIHLAQALGTTAADLLAGCTLPDAIAPTQKPAKAARRTRTNKGSAPVTARPEEPSPVLRRARRQPPVQVA